MSSTPAALIRDEVTLREEKARQCKGQPLDRVTRRLSFRAASARHHRVPITSPHGYGPGREGEVLSMKIRPLADRVVVTRLEQEQKTKGGIIIPDTAKEKPLDAVIVAVGRGKTLKNGKVQALDVKAGDRVLIGKYSGTEFKLDGVEYVIVGEDDILAVVS